MSKLLRYAIASASITYVILIAILIGSPETFDIIGGFLYAWILFSCFIVFFYIVDILTPTQNNDGDNKTEAVDKESSDSND